MYNFPSSVKRNLYTENMRFRWMKAFLRRFKLNVELYDELQSVINPYGQATATARRVLYGT